MIRRIAAWPRALIVLASAFAVLAGCDDESDSAPNTTQSGGNYKIIDLSTGAMSDAADVPDLLTDDTYRTTHLVLKRIPAGSFEMGDQVGGTLPKSFRSTR